MINSVCILCRPGDETAFLCRNVNGRDEYEPITKEQILRIIESAAAALRRMDHEKP